MYAASKIYTHTHIHTCAPNPQVATTLLKAEAAAGLEEHAPVQEVIKRLEAQRYVRV